MIEQGIDIEKMRDGRLHVVVSVSGGKDSAATALHLRELGIPHRRVFADTGWEAVETYRYLDELERRLGPIERVRAEIDVQPERMEHVERIESILGVSPSAMVRRCIRHATLPSRRIRWCTSDLKVAPLRKYHQSLMADGRLVVSTVGVRADESAKRASLGEWELGDAIDAIVWRPLIRWTTEDVIAIHHRHGLPPNPLYLRGMSRVGCWPCVNACKAEYAAIGRDDRRLRALRDLEQTINLLRGSDERGLGHANWYMGHATPGSPIGLQPTIDEVVEWASTDRGGRQFAMFSEETDARDGCMRWGLCEPPKEGA